MKVDLLGLGMLAAMEDSLRICHQRGKNIDLKRLNVSSVREFWVGHNGGGIGVGEDDAVSLVA